MNKLQIKAEILATLTALATTVHPDSALITDLRKIEDKKAVLDILIRELITAPEQKAILVCWLMTELIDKDVLSDELWNIIKAPEYNDHIKMIAFNMLKDLGNKVDYDVISGYFEKFNELINEETKQYKSLTEALDACKDKSEISIKLLKDYLRISSLTLAALPTLSRR